MDYRESLRESNRRFMEELAKKSKGDPDFERNYYENAVKALDAAFAETNIEEIERLSALVARFDRTPST